MSDDQQNNFREYVERMKEIRLLSTPDLQEIRDADDYSRTLIRNFSRIGELAVENRKLVDGFIKPILTSHGKLTEDITEKLGAFSDLLVDDDAFAEVDTHLSEALNDLLLMANIESAKNIDADSLVMLMAKKVMRDYYVVSALTRYDNEETENIRKRAIENRNRLAEYLKKDAFVRLSDEAKGAALQYSLMGALLYENNLRRMPTAYWEKCMAVLDQAEEILQDPFYREQYPDYDWEIYTFRLYYYGSFQAYSLLPPRIAERVAGYAQKAMDYLMGNPKEVIRNAVDVEQEKELHLLASIQAGFVSAREACEKFYEAYEKRDPHDYSITGIDKNMDTASSYLCISKFMKLELNEEDYDRYRTIQLAVLDYMYHVPNQSDKYLKCVTIFGNYPRYFREVPNAMTLEDFCLYSFAALHPPTYIHVNMVARLTECMTRHLLAIKPELFIGFPGCDDVEAVKASRDRIIRYAYHAALCHDMGKLFIIDTISMYGRNLMDEEFFIIKNHPVTGAEIAAEQESTRDYVDVILGHHLWYDGSRGYPADFDKAKSPYRTVIDIVLAADCLDAATDTVGRSYNRGKTFEDYEKEVEEGAGTHYAPYLPELFRYAPARADIGYLMNKGRQRLYRETYLLLKRCEAS